MYFEKGFVMTLYTTLASNINSKCDDTSVLLTIKMMKS